MSQETWSAHFRHRMTYRLSDGDITLVDTDKETKLELQTSEESDATHISCWIQYCVKRQHESADYINPPYKFITTLNKNRIIISGHPENDSPHKNVDDLIDVVEVLGKHLGYISPEKTESLLKQLDELRLARIIERDKKIGRERRHRKKIAQGQEKHREKYTTLAEKIGLDPTAIFMNSTTQDKRTTLQPKTTTQQSFRVK